MTRFQTGETFTYATNSAASTASVTFSASVRKVVLQNIVAYADASNAILSVEASGTVKWAMVLGSACQTRQFDNLWIQNDGVATLSCNLGGASASAYLAICGQYISL